MRDSDGAEVDLILEADDGRVVGIEVKASSTPRIDEAVADLIAALGLERPHLCGLSFGGPRAG